MRSFKHILIITLSWFFRTSESFFKIDWQEDGSAGIIGNDGKYLSNKLTGILYSATDTLQDNNKFKIIIMNRPCLVLKNDFGFVGLKGSQYMCNKANYDVLKVEHTDDGSYLIKGIYIYSTESVCYHVCNRSFWTH